METRKTPLPEGEHTDTVKIPWTGWRLIRRIGTGGFGSVYEIERTEYGSSEKAALKIITIPKSSAEVEADFSNGYDEDGIRQKYRLDLKSILKEYNLMSKLQGHSNLVSCEDVYVREYPDKIQWDVFIRMELLTPMLKSGIVFKEPEVIKLGMDICKALIVCESHNIIHRDIKPQNIFYSNYGDYKLGDFGIAKTMDHATQLTMIGTLNYMAPEVKHHNRYGKEVDIYSLGIVLYMLMNQRKLPLLPFSDRPPTAKELDSANERRFSGEELPPPIAASPELSYVILKACSYDPSKRYHTAKEFLDDLEKVSTGRFVIPDPYDPGENKTELLSDHSRKGSGTSCSKEGLLRNKTKRSHFIVGGVVGILCVFLVLLAVNLLNRKSSKPEKQVSTQTAEPQTESQTEEQTESQTEEQTELQTEEQTEPQTEEQTELQTEEQTTLQTEAQTELTAEPQTELATEPQTVAKHQLTVHSGSGSGIYCEGERIIVTAEKAEDGFCFSKWICSGSILSDALPGNETIEVTIGTEDLELTAEYKEQTYEVKVLHGDGDGSYLYNSRVDISADLPTQGYDFSRWCVEDGGAELDNEDNSTTYFYMPASNVTLVAEYEKETEDPLQRKMDNIPYIPDANKTTFDGHTYAVLNYRDIGANSWNEIVSYLENMGGYPVTINSDEENNRIVDLGLKSGHNYMLIGLTDLDRDGTWTWTQGNSDYRCWGPDKPDSSAKENYPNGRYNAEYMKIDENFGTWTCTDINDMCTHWVVCEWDFLF